MQGRTARASACIGLEFREMIITSGSNVGTVAVYSIDGREVASPEVLEGENVIRLAKGVCE